MTIIGFIATSVALRKLANTPVHMTEEVVGLLLSVSLLLGLPMVTLKSEHVKMSLLIAALDPAARKWVALTGTVLSIVFFGWLLVEAREWFEFAFQRNLKTLTSRILLYPWMAMLPLSLIICTLILLARIAGILPEPIRRP
ncbi:TRAP transporter small permease [Ruegeria hyattellae]|uniref:TRAP transporter small permease n=1 Tax=Ruegeria hyattellae TaxID=3233337 RepID=UPI00355B70E3